LVVADAVHEVSLLPGLRRRTLGGRGFCQIVCSSPWPHDGHRWDLGNRGSNATNQLNASHDSANIRLPRSATTACSELSHWAMRVGHCLVCLVPKLCLVPKQSLGPR